jgi:hypothetical protein
MKMDTAIRIETGVPSASMPPSSALAPPSPVLAVAGAGAGGGDIARFLTAVVPWPPNDGDGYINSRSFSGAATAVSSGP